jgi:uncharacterized protein (DUF58 family)
VGRGAADRAGILTRRTFPLIPRRRPSGTPFGERTSSRRGRGKDVAGTRPYVPGDPIATIDWFASGRLSSARGSDEFVVRESYAEESPRVLAVVDRRPSMGLYPSGSPWLDKPAAVVAAVEAIGRSAAASRAEFGEADAAGARARMLTPGAVSPRVVVDRIRRAPFDAPEPSLGPLLAHLLARRAELPQGTFVFVLSDFLGPVPSVVWSRLRTARWDVVPVVLQDPTWEQSFPPVAGVLLPVADASGDESSLVRLSRAEVEARRHENEQRLEALLKGFRRFGFDPVVIGSSEPAAIDTAFLHWAERRRGRRSGRVR